MLRYIFAAAATVFLAAAQTPAVDPLYRDFRNPPSDARPFVRWWWNGLYVTEAEVQRELDVMKAAGIGGVEINSIAMPNEAIRPGSKPLDWLSPEWNRTVGFAAAEARKRGLTPDLIVGSGWPFGGRFLAKEDQIQRIALMKREVDGPVRLTTSVEELAKSRVARGERRLAFLRFAPAAGTKFDEGREVKAAADGSIAVDVPAGKFVLYAGFHDTGFSNVKLGAPGSDGPVVDHLNARAVRGYLDRLSSTLGPALGGKLGPAIRAMFVDSLELDHANWTGDFASEFRRRRGYELDPYLPFVLDRSNANDTVLRARYDFNLTLVELFRERFLKTYIDWCRANGVKGRIQAYGRETHPLEGSMDVDLPEAESWLWADGDKVVPGPTVVNKYVASGANLTGQRLVSFEAMTNAVPVFRESMEEFKIGLDMSLLTGVNHPILHGFNYTPPEAGFPGWVRFGCYFNEKNSWWPYFRRWTDYSARLTAVMRQSSAVAQVAILGPRADEWARAGLLYQPFPETLIPWYGYHLWQALQQNGVQSDYVSESVLQQAKFSRGRLTYGLREYEAVIVEDAESLEPATAAALERYTKSGGKVVFIGRVPSRAPGLKGDDAVVKRALGSARAIEAPKQSGPFPRNAIQIGLPVADQQTLLAFAADLLKTAQIRPAVALSKTSIDVSHTHHQNGLKDLYFFSNRSRTDSASFDATFLTLGKQAWVWDPHTGERWPYGSGNRLSIRLGPEESMLLVFEPGDATGTPAPKPLVAGAARLQVGGPWQASFTPVDGKPAFDRTLDKLVDISKIAADPAMASFGGSVVYRVAFDFLASGRMLLDLGSVAGISEVMLNGKALGVRWYGRHLYDTAGALQQSGNKLEVKVTVMIGNYAKSLAATNATAKRWAGWFPPIPAGLMGPVRLVEPRSE